MAQVRYNCLRLCRKKTLYSRSSFVYVADMIIIVCAVSTLCPVTIARYVTSIEPEFIKCFNDTLCVFSWHGHRCWLHSVSDSRTAMIQQLLHSVLKAFAVHFALPAFSTWRCD